MRPLSVPIVLLTLSAASHVSSNDLHDRSDDNGLAQRAYSGASDSRLLEIRRRSLRSHHALISREQEERRGADRFLQRAATKDDSTTSSSNDEYTYFSEDAGKDNKGSSSSDDGDDDILTGTSKQNLSDTDATGDNDSNTYTEFKTATDTSISGWTSPHTLTSKLATTSTSYNPDSATSASSNQHSFTSKMESSSSAAAQSSFSKAAARFSPAAALASASTASMRNKFSKSASSASSRSLARASPSAAADISASSLSAASVSSSSLVSAKSVASVQSASLAALEASARSAFSTSSTHASVTSQSADDTSASSVSTVLITRSVPGGTTVITSYETLAATGITSVKAASTISSSLNLGKNAIIGIAVSLGAIGLIAIIFTIVRKRRQALDRTIRPLDFTPTPGYGTMSGADSTHRGVTRTSQESWLGGRPMSEVSHSNADVVPPMMEEANDYENGRSRVMSEACYRAEGRRMLSMPDAVYGPATARSERDSHPQDGFGRSSHSHTDLSGGNLASAYYDGSTPASYEPTAVRDHDLAHHSQAVGGATSPYAALQRGSSRSGHSSGSYNKYHYAMAYGEEHETDDPFRYPSGGGRNVRPSDRWSD